MINAILEPVFCREKFLKDCDYADKTLDLAIKAAIAKIDYAIECFGCGLCS